MFKNYDYCYYKWLKIKISTWHCKVSVISWVIWELVERLKCWMSWIRIYYNDFHVKINNLFLYSFDVLFLFYIIKSVK